MNQSTAIRLGLIYSPKDKMVTTTPLYTLWDNNTDGFIGEVRIDLINNHINEDDMLKVIMNNLNITSAIVKFIEDGHLFHGSFSYWESI